MTYVASSARIPSETRWLSGAFAAVEAIGEAVATTVRKRWIYHRTLSQLESCSARSLQDLGVDKGVKEFARRAAGL